MVLSNNCIGCQACMEFCPTKAINFSYNDWGEGKVQINTSLCVNCGLCDKICPSLKQNFNKKQENVYAVISNNNRKTGSSGGVFFELACQFINEGGIVYGAMFDEKLKLIHKGVDNIKDLIPLCKSKYVHSDMTNIYSEIKENLIKGKKIMFVGTPCQVSAVKNLFSNKYSNQLLLIDFLCHGTGTQKIFDLCLLAEEKKKKGKIINFTFRSKAKKAQHSFSYKLIRNNKFKQISGYAFEFPYYNAFLKYNIFNDYCYSCKYATNTRVGDITLGDFWGIQNYNKKLKDFNGVSMISLNNNIGVESFDKIKNKCNTYKYPLEYATKHNQSFNKPEKYPIKKSEYLNSIKNKDTESLINLLSCQNLKKEYLYAIIPDCIKKIYTKIKRK